MRLLILLTTVSVILAGCSSGSSAPAESAPSQNPTSVNQTQPPPSTQPDYSKITCGSNSICANACITTNPYLDDDEVRNSICTIAGGLDPVVCNSLIKTNDDVYKQSNSWCESLKVDEVIDINSLESLKCKDDSLCPTICAQLFKVQDDLAIERAASAGGGFSGQMYKDIYANHLAKAQYDACMDAPYDFIYGLLLN